MENKKYVVYTRVSTDKQEDSGLGLQAQLDDYKRFTQNGVVLAYFTEIESGRKSNRKELAKAIELAKKENAILIVAKLDRLTRNSLFLNQLIASELKFVCCDNPDANATTLRIFSAMAEDEVDRLRKRTSSALAVIKKIIKEQGFYTTKNGNVITSLGNQLNFDSKELKSEFYRNIASNRTYAIKSETVFTLVKSLKGNGKSVTEIQDKLTELGYSVSRKTIYNYLKRKENERI